MEIFYSILIFIAGWLAGKILDKSFTYCQYKLENWKLKKDQGYLSINYNPSADGVVVLHTWSYNHRLDPANTKFGITSRPNTPFIKDKEEFQSIVDSFKAQNIRGEICYMVNYNIDHRDNDYGKHFELYVAPCDYSEASAISGYLKTHMDVKDEILKIVSENPKNYFRQALPSDIFLNLIVLSKNNKILALKRSKAVASAQGLWCIGAYETMEMPFSKTACADSNFHKLAERCLFEEIGISPNEICYKTGKNRQFFNTYSIFISCLSLSLHHMGIMVTAIVKLDDITEEEICERIISSAHSKYEHDGVAWLEYNKREMKRFIEIDSGLYADFVKANDEKWIAYAKLSLYELYRVGNFHRYHYN